MPPERDLEQALAALKPYFDADGHACDFAALEAARERGHLAACLADLEAFDPGEMRIGGQTAFWVNVYNAGLLRDAPELALALEGAEPDPAAFFERARLGVLGAEFSLDDIQHGLLRGNTPAHGRLRAPMRRDDPRLAWTPIALDERLHFALYTGARSSPAFRVFEAGQLDEALEDAALRYVRRMAKVESDGAVIAVPELLHWYAADFGGASGVLEFVLSRLDEASVERAEAHMERLRLRYVRFDWRLARR